MTNNSSRFDYKLVIALSIAVTACGGEGSGSSSGSSPETITPPIESDTIYYAQDVVRETIPTSTFYVDLSDSMESSDGSTVVLTDVTPLNSDESCKVTSIDETGFTIDASNVKACDYRYKVGSNLSPQTTTVIGDGYAEATARAAVGEITEQLPPLSGVTSSSTSVTVDLPYELGNLGYDLDTNTYSLSSVVSLPNSDSTLSVAIADPAGNTIEYTPGSGIPTGVERILFTYSDGVNVLSGTLDVAVSTESNTAPTAMSAFITTYTHPETGFTVSKIPNGLNTKIDVSHLISDPDGDTLHLVDVYTYGATVSIPEDANGDGDYFNDTVFEFNGTTPGITNATYVVSDGRGGYATGVLRLNVADVYGNIFLNTSEPNLLFAPPLTARVADAAEVEYVPVVGDGVTAVEGLATATHDWIAANGYCESTGGSLPTMADLQRLRQHLMDTEGTASPELFQFHQWPEDLPYWSRTEGSTSGHYQAYDFGADGGFGNEDGDLYYYVACLSNEAVEVRVSGTESISPTVDPESPDPTAPDLTYEYQLISIGADESEEALDNSLVSWTAFELPHYVGFSAEDATVTVRQSEIVETDEETSFKLVGCTEEGICDEQVVTISFSWNKIIESVTYEYSPFLNLSSAADAGITGLTIDSADYTVVNNHQHEWFEGPYVAARNWTEYSNACSQMNINGGGWLPIPNINIFNDYTTALDTMFNEHPDMQGLNRTQIYSHTGIADNMYHASSPNVAIFTQLASYTTRDTHQSPYNSQVTPNWTFNSGYTTSSTNYYGDDVIANHVICYRTK